MTTRDTIDLARAFRFVPRIPTGSRRSSSAASSRCSARSWSGAVFVMGYFVRLVRRVARGDARPLPEWDDLGGIFSDGLRALVVYLVYVVPVAMILPLTLGGVLLLVIAGRPLQRRRAPRRGAGRPRRRGHGRHLRGHGDPADAGADAVRARRPAPLRRATTACAPASRCARTSPSSGATWAATRSRSCSTSWPAWPRRSGSCSAAWASSPRRFWSFCILAWGLGEVARRDPVLSLPRAAY